MLPLRWSRSLYDWVLSWGNSPHAQTALFFLSMAEASFFPVPPDALLIALCMGAHKRWIRFAAVCSVGSIIGGVLGYLIGKFAFDLIGAKLLALTASISGSDPKVLLEQANYWFNEKELIGMNVGAWAVGIAGFTPLPYKVFTIAAGFFKMAFIPFLIASAISRSLRFFIVAGLVGTLYRKYGERIKLFIDKYFNLLAIAFVVLLIAGFLSLNLLKGD
ncbi:MAG: DedA family protein [Candidatus Zixiibacteriota bacterium]|nr:MAG: DedA family protein [candidate division Zixibacteria bacterium]